MQKTMYTAMNGFAMYIAGHEGTFDSLWKSWSAAYLPPEEMIPELKKMGQRLCQADRQDILAVPEAQYRSVVRGAVLTPKNRDGGNLPEQTD